MWWSVKNCDGDEKKLRESWLCLQYHTVNKHCWKIGKKWYKCNHAPLSRGKVRKTKWLKPGSPAHIAYQRCHTDKLQYFHSLLTNYCPKRQEFDYDVMWTRHQLAIMDHNHNVNRQQVVVE